MQVGSRLVYSLLCPLRGKQGLAQNQNGLNKCMNYFPEVALALLSLATGGGKGRVTMA